MENPSKVYTLIYYAGGAVTHAISTTSLVEARREYCGAVRNSGMSPRLLIDGVPMTIRTADLVMGYDKWLSFGTLDNILYSRTRRGRHSRRRRDG